MKKMLAGFLAVRLVFGMCGSDVLTNAGGDGGDVTVMMGTTKLHCGEDYEIMEDSCMSNIKKGNASVKNRDLGDCGGTKTVKLKI